MTRAAPQAPVPPLAARRRWLQGGAGALCVRLSPPGWAQGQPATAALAEPFAPALLAAITAFTGGAAAPEGELVEIDIEPLVENGNTVPVVVRVPARVAPPGQVRRLALFNERNPEPGVAVFQFSAASARAEVTTRMRLATTQRVVALAQLADGRFTRRTVEVIVTLAACIEP